jgi:CPA2 family monovalent cation:H+ antiporter-2
MSGVCILLLAAAVAFGLAKWLRLPPIPLLMLVGAVLHELANLWEVEVPDALLGEMMEIGLAMLVFTAGVDLSPRRMLGRTRAIIIVATVQFFMLGVVGAITAFALGYDLTIALYLGCALSASSTLVVVRHLQRRRQLFEPFGRLVLGVLLVQDLFIILIMVALLKSPQGGIESFFAVTRAVGLGCVAIGIHRWCVPWITRRLKLDDEELMLGALGILFVFSGFAYVLKLPFLVGAFFAGFAISAFPLNGLVRGMLGSLSSFFLALFFIAVGATLTLPSVDMLWHSLVFIVVLIGVTVGLVSIIGEIVGYSTRASIEAGILLSQTSEFSLLLALAGMASGQISAELFSMITLITVSTMTLTPLISNDKIAWSLMKLHPRYRRGELDCEKRQGHAVLLGYGRAGRQTLQLFKEHDIPVIVIDDDAAVIRKLIAHGVTCIQGDGASPRILAQANCREATVVVCSMRRTRDSKTALEYLKDYPTKVFIRTFEPTETEFVHNAGGTPIQTARASAHSLIEWLDVNLTEEKRS